MNFRHSVGALRSTVYAKIGTIRTYVNSTASMLVGLAAHALGFIILARGLGTEQFGNLMLLTTIPQLGAVWCSHGVSEVFRRRYGREPSDYPAILGHCLLAILVPGAILTCLITLGIVYFVPFGSQGAKFTTVLIFVTSNVVCFSWITVAEFILLARGDIARANFVNASFGLARTVVAVIACLGFGVASVDAWAFWHGGLYVFGSFVSALTIVRYGAPKWHVMTEEISKAATISLSGLLAVSRQNADIFVLSAVAGPATIGSYGVTQRLLGLASVLGASLDRLVYDRFVAAGKTGPKAALALARKFGGIAFALSGLASLLIFIFAPLLPWIFGADYAPVVLMTQILCWSLISSALKNIAHDALNASDEHRLRLLTGTVAAVSGILVIVPLTLAYDLNGLYIGIYVSEILMLGALWGTLIYVARRASHSPASAVAEEAT